MISNSLEYHSKFIQTSKYKENSSNYNEDINKELNEEEEKPKLIQDENFEDESIFGHISSITENPKYSEDFIDSFLNNNQSKGNSFSFYQ